MEHTQDSRKMVIHPKKMPKGRTPDEHYQVLAMHSKEFHQGVLDDSGYHYGPYMALWVTKKFVLNPEYPRSDDPQYLEKSRNQPLCLPEEYIISLHDEDAGSIEILLRTTKEEEARQHFLDLQEEYPEGNNGFRYDRRHGGSRIGARRPALLEDPVVVPAEMPRSLRDALDALAKKESARSEKKVSRNEIIRRFIREGMNNQEE